MSVKCRLYVTQAMSQIIVVAQEMYLFFFCPSFLFLDFLIKKIFQLQFTFNIILYSFQEYSTVVRPSYTLYSVPPDISTTPWQKAVVRTHGGTSLSPDKRNLTICDNMERPSGYYVK